MKATKTLNAICVIWAVAGLVGCQQAERSFSTDEEVQLLSVPSEEQDPTSPPLGGGTPPIISSPGTVVTLPGVPDNKRNKIPQFCNAFVRPEPTVIDMSATNDETTSGGGENETIQKARTVKIVMGGGNIEVLSAITVLPFNASGGGRVSINAMTIKKVSITGGSQVCLHADRIEEVGTGGGGDQTIIANKIDIFQPGPGRLHLFGTTVGLLKKGQQNAQICLYNGAKILNLGPYTFSQQLDEDCWQMDFL